METIFYDRKIVFGHMTRKEIEEQGFKDTGLRYGEREIYTNGEFTIAFNPEDNWFTRYHSNG